MTAVETFGTAAVEQIMGMPIVVDIRDSDAPPDLADRVFAWLREVDATFSTYRDDSVISRLNRGELSDRGLPTDVREVLRRCEELRLETEGYFDVRAASADSIDPSGLVKGWAVDRAGTILDVEGVGNYAIYAGGDILVRGGALPDERWLIGIQHPLMRDGVSSVLALRDHAVATSGAYARGDHVLDPHTHEAPTGLLSVTITGPVLATADAYATAVFAMGERGLDWLRALPARGYEGAAVTADEIVHATPGFGGMRPDAAVD